jgi:hypothetical protein
MKKKVLLSVLGTVLTVGILIAIDANKSINLLSTNGFILENATALAYGECSDKEVFGSELTITCNTPTDDKGGKCSYSVVTCQGSTGCCTRDLCKDHD